MWEFFTKWLSMWPLFFVNGFIDYGEQTILRPALASGFGTWGAFVSKGSVFSAKQAASTTSYFTQAGSMLGGIFGASSTASGTGMRT